MVFPRIQSKEVIKNSIWFLLLTINVLALLWPAIYNGFPLVYSDTGTYINSGFIGEVPIDRPIIYGLFVRYMSLGHSLWLVIICQALIVLLFIFGVVKELVKTKPFLVTTILTITLSFTTGLSNYTSQIMPDIFTATTIIGVSIVITSPKMKGYEYLVFILTLFSSITHLSNLLLVIGIMIIVILLTIFRVFTKTNSYRAILIVLTSMLSLLLINKSYSGKFQISRASNVFVIARLIETGIVKDYLIKNCNKKKYEMCSQIDRIPEKAWMFIWNDNSPLYEGRCKEANWTSCWEEKNTEYGVIIKDIASNPKYLSELVKTYSKDFFKQIIDFEIGPLIPMQKNSPVQNTIRDHMNNEMESYCNSKQYKTTLEFLTLSKIQFCFVIGSSFILLIMFFLSKGFLSKEKRIFIVLILLGIIGNALTVEIFSTILNRYQARIIWVVPLIVLILSYSILERNILENKIKI